MEWWSGGVVERRERGVCTVYRLFTDLTGEKDGENIFLRFGWVRMGSMP
jgi:hypothetical protein